MSEPRTTPTLSENLHIDLLLTNPIPHCICTHPYLSEKVSTQHNKEREEKRAMATALSSLSLSTPSGLVSNKTDIPKAPKASIVSWKGKTGYGGGRMMIVRPVKNGPTPPGISEKVEESIEKAKEACEEDAVSGECAAAWDEVEELSAAASHARERAKDADPLEAYCKDNPETDECRTYED